MKPDRILPDTHVVLWALQDPNRLGERRALLEDPAVTRILSAVVVWEVAIKTRLGRLGLPLAVNKWRPRAVADLAAERLPITDHHAAAVADLPLHHRDPFDRLLVAQSQILKVPIITADPAFTDYDVEVLGIKAA